MQQSSLTEEVHFWSLQNQLFKKLIKPIFKQNQSSFHGVS